MLAELRWQVKKHLFHESFCKILHGSPVSLLTPFAGWTLHIHSVRSRAGHFNVARAVVDEAVPRTRRDL